MSFADEIKKVLALKAGTGGTVLGFINSAELKAVIAAQNANARKPVWRREGCQPQLVCLPHPLSS